MGFINGNGSLKVVIKNRSMKLHFPKKELFAFFGLFTQWIDYDGTVLNTYTMVSTIANELMSEIHNTKDRMPIILKQKDEQHWLDGENYKDFKFPYSNNLVAHPENPNTSSQLNLF